MERLITKSFKRLLDKGIHRGFITYEELGKSLGKRHFTQENIESAFLHIFDNKISLVAEIKKASPSAGIIIENYNPIEIAKIYTKERSLHNESLSTVFTNAEITQLEKLLDKATSYYHKQNYQ